MTMNYVLFKELLASTLSVLGSRRTFYTGCTGWLTFDLDAPAHHLAACNNTFSWNFLTQIVNRNKGADTWFSSF